jgi:hypothetical protein
LGSNRGMTTPSLHRAVSVIGLVLLRILLIV